MKSFRFAVPPMILVCLACSRLAGEERQSTDFEKLVGQPADIAPSAYQYRADRKPEENPPESWIGLMKYASLPFDKPVDVHAPALKKVLCGLIWEEVRRVRRVALVWNGAASRRPKPEEVVLTYFDAEAEGNIPTWWNPTVLREADKPRGIRRRAHLYLQHSRGHVRFGRPRARANRMPRPTKSPRCGLSCLICGRRWTWRSSGGSTKLRTRGSDYSGRIEAYDGIMDHVRPLAGDAGTTMKGPGQWRSAPVRSGRRGVRLSLLYLGTSKDRKVWPYNAEPEDVARTIVTVWSSAGNFSFLASDLEKGPILAPEYGFFVGATKPQAAIGPVVPIRETLGDKLTAIPGVPKVHGWAINGMPWFGVNSAYESGAAGNLTVPARSVAMHPARTGDVAVGWCSPIQGRVSVTGKVAMGDSKGGNGVEWSVTREDKAKWQVLSRGAIDTGGSQAIPADAGVKKLAEIAVDAGDTLSLVVGAKGGNHICDTTLVEFQIAEVGGKGRVWNLAKDVVDSVHAGNPHADASGNVGVWHFYACTAPSKPPFRLSPARGRRRNLSRNWPRKA